MDSELNIIVVPGRVFDEELHAAAVASLFTAAQRRLSLVDCTSFELMRRLGLTDVLALDADFASQGFNLLPGGQLNEALREINVTAVSMEPIFPELAYR